MVLSIILFGGFKVEHSERVRVSETLIKSSAFNQKLFICGDKPRSPIWFEVALLFLRVYECV